LNAEAERTMRVLMLPAEQFVKANPFTYLLVNALRGCGVEVLSASRTGDAFSKVDLLHVHWPHNYASIGSALRVLVATAQFMGLCFYHRLRGARIIWTVHDLRSLTSRHEFLEKVLMAVFTRVAGGLIFLNRTSQDELYSERPYMRKLPCAVIPHGTYGNIYPPRESVEQSRAGLGLADQDASILGFPGAIKAYKGLDGLLEAMHTGTGQSRLTLLIAGRCDPPAYARQIEMAVAAGRARGVDIEWINERLDDAQLVRVIDASDAVALPYSRTWNSGMAVLSLERGKRLLCSNSKVFSEMAEELGPYWIVLADPDLASALARLDVAQAPTEQDFSALQAFLSDRQWPRIGQETAAFYQEVIRPSQGRVTPSTTGAAAGSTQRSRQ
jgi:beta-1,4-mannosyltransferase